VARIFNTKAARVLDFDITIKATAGPVTFGDTKEGMFGLRVASSMDVNRKKGGKITNAEGITDDAAWGKASPWVDYTGPVGGETVGIAILNHPDSFRYPTTWHVRTYGLFAANPFGWHDFGRSEKGDYTIPDGERISFRYRVIFHKGDTASADIDASFKTYAKPPSVVVRAD
jgi:methane monooxygenase PmoA-like